LYVDSRPVPGGRPGVHYAHIDDDKKLADVLCEKQNTSVGLHSMKTSSSQRGWWWVLGQAAFLGAVLALGLAPRRHQIFPGDILTGGSLMAVGGLCAVAGLLALKGMLTPFPEPRAHGQLVQHGIYSLMRHPLYTSLIVTSLGWALFRQSTPALIVILPLAVFFDAKARREEHHLRARFPEYGDYAQRSRRFIPWIY
jgi:protein-S-isoprenylcysteine O-methyltransferase Ste14